MESVIEKGQRFKPSRLDQFHLRVKMMRNYVIIIVCGVRKPPESREDKVISSWAWPLWWFFAYMIRLFLKSDFRHSGCPYCNHEFDWWRSPWYEQIAGGYYNTADSGAVDWSEGIQQCPRCRHRWGIGD